MPWAVLPWKDLTWVFSALKAMSGFAIEEQFRFASRRHQWAWSRVDDSPSSKEESLRRE